MDYDNNNEALAIVKRMVADGQVSQDVAEKYFPELKESEDEVVRKAIINIVTFSPEAMFDRVLVSRDDALAWLEKQGQTFTKKDVDDAYLKGVCDAKHELEKQGEQKQELLTKEKALKNSPFVEQKPVWSEEDDRMMNDTLAVVDWYAGKHRNISVKVSNWLKLLKSRVLSSSLREFDKEEGNVINHLIAICDDAMCYDTFAGCSKKDIERYKSFLTNLKFGINPQPQTTWKPSDEQMKVLDAAVMHSHLTTAEYDGLVKLREQLKKLREE